ncbi:MAG: DnaJ domain-containing protein [Chloroflexi bacterium]|nr:DnaJ domain-containing protein [Chloroflexota bacterium]
MDYYSLLEVDRRASFEVIEKAHKALSLKYHPDRQSPDTRTEATEKMKRINEAYGVLSNPRLRSSYDMALNQEKWRIFMDHGLLGLYVRYVK